MALGDDRFELPLENFDLMNESLDGDVALTPLFLMFGRFERYDVARSDGGEEKTVARRQNDVGLVYGSHRRKIGGAENKAAVYQSEFVGPHNVAGLECHLRVTAF